MLNTDTIHLFLNNFGYKPKVNFKPITIRRFVLILETAKRWHGRTLSQFLLDCFVEIEPNKLYRLAYPSENEITYFLHQEWVA